MKELTLCIIRKEGKVLLGMQNPNKFGEGYWNGMGGKVEKGETPEEAAKREVKEETGLEVSKIEQRGILRFHFSQEDETLLCHVFEADDFEGKLEPSNEMSQFEWFSPEDIPYDQMWRADYYWMNCFLSGKLFKGTFIYNNQKEKKLQFQEIKPVLQAEFNHEFSKLEKDRTNLIERVNLI